MFRATRGLVFGKSFRHPVAVGLLFAVILLVDMIGKQAAASENKAFRPLKRSYPLASAMTSQQLEVKAKRIQALVEEKTVQRHGMIPMFVRAGDYKLPTAEDYRGAYRHRHLRGKTEADFGLPPMHVWRAWEDTAADTAYYLGATAYRYRCTADPESLAICRRTLGALKYIYSVAVAKGEKGRICKPYGGVWSNQSSGDQVQCVAWGLAAYRPIAPPEDLASIDSMTREIARYNIETDYVSPHGYFHYTRRL